LRLDGRKWIGMKRPIAADAGDPLMLLVAAPRDELVAGATNLVERQLLIGLGVIVVTLGLVWWSARRISRPLEILSGSVEEIGRGHLDTPLPEIWNPTEVANLVDVTDRMRVQLKDHIAEHAARLADEQRRAREMEIARHIQLSMLPSPLRERVDGQFAIAAELRPAREVGGDLYDFFMQDGHRLVFAIADVADKGVPAAILMARVTGLLRAVGRGDARPDHILRELDARLSEGNDTCTFVTAACGQLDAGNGELWYASAGHDRPLLRRADGTTSVLAVEGGPALGLELNKEFPLWKGCLAPGDTIVLCTDGVTEAFDADGMAFGVERLLRVVADTPVDSMDTLPDRLAEAVERFSVGGGPRDDLAVLAVQYRSPDVLVEGVQGEAWRLSIASAPEDMARAQRRIEGILRARQVPDAMIHDCSLATEEVLTNIAKHAYGGDGRGEARIEVRVRPEEIRLRFEDTGPPFNPLEQPEPDSASPLATRPLGGHGIVLVKGLVDECDYAREGQFNVLTLHRARPALPADPTVPELTTQLARGGAMPLEIAITSQEPGGRRVMLQGRLDTLTAPNLDEELAALLDAPEVTSIVFELRALDYISSAGIRCLIRARKALAARGGEVAIVNPQPGVRKVFEIVKALPAEQVFASAAELDAYLDAMQRKTRDPS
jgi:sigma-B regulation protein RsbU (phosphoserine phosphatase)